MTEHFLSMLTDQMPALKSLTDLLQAFVLSNPASFELVRPSENANLAPLGGNELTLVKAAECL